MTVERPTPARSGSPTHIGRSAELTRLVETITAAPSVAVIEGEAGIGKSRLLSEARARPEAGRRRFLAGACRHIRDPFPLGPVVEALRGVGADLADHQLTPAAGALRPLLPELTPVLPPPLEPLDDRAAERHRVFRGLLDVLGALGPTVLAVEDVHWADEQTLDFLAYLLADPPSELAVVLTVRTEEVPAPVRSLTARLPASVGRFDCVLAPFDESHTGELAAALLDIDHVSEEFASYLCERTSGLPFAIQELVALLQERGTLVRRGVSWARRALDELDVPVRIRDQVLERVSRLSAAGRAATQAAAVLQLPMPTSVLVSTSALPRDDAVSGLEEALGSGLLGDLQGQVGFRHVLAMQAVYGSIPLPRRQELHHRAAVALRDVADPPAVQVAHHLRHADRLDEWVVAAEVAADRALDLGHEDEAARLLEELCREGSLDADQRGRIVLKLGRAAVEATHAAGSAELLATVLRRGDDLPPVVRGELRLLLGRLMANAGLGPEQRRPLYLKAVEELDERPDLKATAMVGLAIHLSPGGSATDRLHWTTAALELLPDVDPNGVYVLGKIAILLMWSGDPRWREVTDQLQSTTGGTPRDRHEVDAFCSAGWGACHPGHYETAERLLTAALDGAIACESRLQELRARSGLALLDYCRGNWHGLSGRLDELMGELTDYAPARIDVEALACCLDVARGAAEPDRLLALTRLAANLGSADLSPPAVGALARLAAERGDVELGRTARRLVAVLESDGVWPLGIRVLAPMTEALTTTGRIDEADDLVTEWARRLRGLDAPLAPPTLAHAQGIVAAAEGDGTAAVEHFREAADGYRQLGCAYEEAQVLEQSAATRLSQNGDASAADPLRSAVETYERLGARQDLDRASGLARRHGVSLPARHRRGRHGYGSELSPRESEVAALAAAGHTNKEIAERLFLSPNTVKRHLTSAMRKLGVPRRTALARHVDAHDPMTP